MHAGSSRGGGGGGEGIEGGRWLASEVRGSRREGHKDKLGLSCKSFLHMTGAKTVPALER